MENKNTVDQSFQEIQNYLMRAHESFDLSRAEAHLRVAERKMKVLENALLSDFHHTDEQLYALVTFKRGQLWNEAHQHIAALAKKQSGNQDRAAA